MVPGISTRLNAYSPIYGNNHADAGDHGDAGHGHHSASEADEWHKQTDIQEPDGTVKHHEIHVEKKPVQPPSPEPNPLQKLLKSFQEGVVEAAEAAEDLVDNDTVDTKKPAPNSKELAQSLKAREQAQDKLEQRLNQLEQQRQINNSVRLNDQSALVEAKTAQKWASSFEQFAKSVSFRLKNPLSTGPATRARQILNNAWWTAAGTGGATHLASWAALRHAPDQAAAHLPGWLDQLSANQQAAVIGGAATVAAGVAAWLTGLGTSKGRDEVDKILAHRGKLSYHKLDADTSLATDQRERAAALADAFAQSVKESTRQPLIVDKN